MEDKDAQYGCDDYKFMLKSQTENWINVHIYMASDWYAIHPNQLVYSNRLQVKITWPGYFKTRTIRPF